jgi:xanthine phosphoribosyltransferase
MTNSLYHTETIISWPELHRDARLLAQMLNGEMTWKGIIAIARGGLIPAALVARELDLRLVDTVCVSSYGASDADQTAQVRCNVKVLKNVPGDGEGFLLIDDLVDTGGTAQVLRGLLPKAHFATLYAKPQGAPLADSYIREFRQDEWLHFPWDIEYRFAPPLKDARKVLQSAPQPNI